MKRLYFILAIFLFAQSIVLSQRLKMPIVKQINGILNNQDLTLLENSKRQYELANSLLDESDSLWTQIEQQRLKSISATNPQIKSEAINRAMQLQEKSEKNEREALGLFKEANASVFNIYSKNIAKAKTNSTASAPMKEEAGLFQEIATNYFNEAQFKRISITNMKDADFSFELMFDICEMELLAIKKMIKAYGLYMKFKYEINREEEIYYTPIDYIEVSYGDPALVEQILTDESEFEPGSQESAEYKDFEVAIVEGEEYNENDYNSGISNDGRQNPTYSKNEIDEFKTHLADKEILIFKVQIAADTKELSESHLSSIYSDFYPINMMFDAGWYKYSIGQFPSYKDAMKLRRDCGVKDAFVVVFLNGKRISIEQGIRLSK